MSWIGQIVALNVVLSLLMSGSIAHWWVPQDMHASAHSTQRTCIGPAFAGMLNSVGITGSIVHWWVGVPGHT